MIRATLYSQAWYRKPVSATGTAILIILVVAVAVGCEGGGTATPQPTPWPAEHLKETPPISELEYGGSVQGNIDTAAGRDFYTFQARAGDRVSLTVDHHDENSGNVIVFTSERRSIAHLSFGGRPTTSSELDDIELEENGEYLIMVQAFAYTTLLYTLHLGPNLSPLEKTPFDGLGQSVEGEITPAGDEDTFTFRAKAGDWVTVVLDHGDHRGDIQVFAPDGKEIARRGFGSFLTSEMEYIEIKQSGEYLVKVDAATTETFRYTLHVSPDLRPLEKAPIAVGQTVKGEISPVGDEDSFIFKAKAGDRVRVVLETVMERDQSRDRGDVRIYAPNGREIARGRFCCSGSESLEILEFKQDGEYVILIEADKSTIYSYTLTLQPF